MKIEKVTVEDAEELLEIYAPYVENTAITFEYDVPTLEEFIERIRHTLEKYPYIVALDNGTIVGYAYAGMFHEREAYSRCVETSIYVDTFATSKLSDEKIVEIIRENFDLRPAGIIRMLDLRRPIYKQTAAYGHFGRNDIDVPWEKLDKVCDLKKYL